MDFELFYSTSGVCTDTRKIEKDCLFICLKGDHFNGNTFAQQALEQGAKYVVVDEKEFVCNENIFLVDDALKFLQNLANYHRLKFTIPIIGITGSNGKTSTKELIYAVLAEKYSVLATIGNLNNHIGVPLTLLRITEKHEIAIIEMGANKFGDIAELCTIAQPTYGIITNIGKAHLEGFIDFEGVLKTKRELYDAIAQNDGTIIYNLDDEVLCKNVPSSISHFTYGQKSDAEVQGELIKLTPFIDMKWSNKNYLSPILSMNMVGKYNFYNYLAAIAFGIRFGLEPAQINAGITNYTPTNNRSQVKKSEKNTLILDCYNANPSSMKSALESFALIENEHKLFIIGDMLELGDQSELEHQAIAELAESLNIKGFTVGPRFKNVTSLSFIHQFENTSEMREFLQHNPLEDSVVLLKGSRGIGLEVLEELL